MIKFFRKIRQKLLSENKFSKYLIYGIGEILLVVIGILIALNVNNFNEGQKVEHKITEALKEIHRDLSNDIKKSNSVILSYKHQDSLIHEILSEMISEDDYKGSNGRRISGVGLNYYPFILETNGYELLMSSSDKIPDRYQQLIASLKKIYTENSDGARKSEDFSANYLLEYWSYLGKEMNWFNEYRYHGKLSNESIEYFAHDPHYKNHLTMYYMLLIQNHYYNIHSFRLNAENAYQELTDLLEFHDLIDSDSTYYNVDVKEYEKIIGTYKGNTTVISISSDSTKLYSQRNNNDKARLLPISRNSFIKSSNKGFITFEFDSTGQATTYHWQLGRTRNAWRKTD